MKYSIHDPAWRPSNGVNLDPLVAARPVNRVGQNAATTRPESFAARGLDERFVWHWAAFVAATMRRSSANPPQRGRSATEDGE